MNFEDVKYILKKVEKPGRYAGGELNAPEVKPDADLKYLICLPDVYEVGISNLGIKILEGILNKRPDTSCEYCFAPWPDMGKELLTNNIKLYSLQSYTPMDEFGIVGFSLQYELSYTNVLYMLELGGIPLLSSERGEEFPVVMAGGPCAVNPKPLYGIVDLFSICDGEETLDELAAVYVSVKKTGGKKSDFLKEAAKVRGVLVPGINDGAPVLRAMLPEIESAFYPTKLMIPNVEAVFNRASLEIFRGCTRGCRFCQAGIIYRPVRERSPELLLKYAKELIYNNGFEELSLSSLSTCDYSELKELIRGLYPVTQKAIVKTALPSTRVDSFEADFVSGDGRLGSITFAPEAGSQRLRDVINKNISEEDIEQCMSYAFGRGFDSVKLYFMLGLPTETDEDILAIAGLAGRIKKIYSETSKSRRSLSLTVSCSTLVPKPFTPFQWEAQPPLEEIDRRQTILKDALKKLKVKFNYHDSRTSKVEAALSRGDERVSSAIINAYRLGAIFDGWTEFFDYSKWERAFSAAGINMDEYTSGKAVDDVLPWDVVDVGVKKEFLLSEREKSFNGIATRDCRGNCLGCGINSAFPEVFKSSCAKNRRQSEKGAAQINDSL